MEALLDPKIQLVTGIGSAGTGKTLLALAAGGAQVVDNNVYNKVIYYKSIVPIGKDIGALPGDLDEKLAPWMGSAYDAFEYMLGSEDALQESESKETGRTSS